MMANNSSREELIYMYIRLAKKRRHDDEQEIFEMLEEYCLPKIHDSYTYYYELYKEQAKVPFKTFYYRYYYCRFDKWDALTLSKKEAQRVKGKRHSESMKKRYAAKREVDNETEEDIIRFIKNDLPLNPRQLKYIESNAEFAKKLKKEGIS